MDMNYAAEIIGIKKDIEYLKSEHQEFKIFMKRFEGVPYQIESLVEKMDNVLDEKRSINSKVDVLLERVSTVEKTAETKKDMQTKKAFDWSAEWIKYISLFLLGLVVILGNILGIKIPFIGGS